MSLPGVIVFFWHPLFMGNQGQNLQKLEEEIRRLLSDRKRSGVLATFTPEQIMAMINLACKNPCDFVYETSQ